MPHIYATHGVSVAGATRTWCNRASGSHSAVKTTLDAALVTCERCRWSVEYNKATRTAHAFVDSDARP